MEETVERERENMKETVEMERREHEEDSWKGEKRY
jgi:hypothetical protein